MNHYNLQNLIRSFTKNESRVIHKTFHTHTDADVKNYVKLFNYLLNEKIDLILLEKRFGKHGLEAARKHLIKTLMKALRDADSDKGLENKLTDLLKDAKILHRKGFEKECFEKLSKTKEIALKNEQHFFYLAAAKLELDFFSRIQFTGIDEAELISKQLQFENILEHQMQVHRHSKLYEILLIRYWRKGMVNSVKEKTKLNDLLLEEYHILNNRNYRSFESEKIHLNFQSVYLLMTGDHEGSLKIFYDLNKLFQDNQQLWTDSPIYYVSILDGILTDLFAMERYNEMVFFTEQLSQITTDEEDIKMQIELLTLHYKISIFNQTNAQPKSKMLFETKEQQIISRLFKKTPSSLQARLCLTISISHFISREYKECLQLLNHILNSSEQNISLEIYNQSRILFLMTQYVLKNYESLPYQLRSFERKLKSIKQESVIENLMIDVLKQLCANTISSAKIDTKFLDRIEALEVSPQYSSVISKLQIKKWIKNNSR